MRISSTETASPWLAARATSAASTRPRSPRRSARIGLRPSRAARSPSRASAPPPASASRHPVLPQRQTTAGVVDDAHVADVAGAALRAAVQVPADHHAGADARADLHEQDRLVVAGDAAAQLPQRHDVDVVVDPHRHREGGLQALAHREAVPAGHDRRRDRPAGAELHRARHADADAPQLARRRGRREELAEQLVDAAEDDLRARRDVPRLLVVREHLAAEVGDRDVDARGPEVGDEQVARRAVEAQQPRRAPAGGRSRAAGGQQPAVEQLLHALGDDGTAQARGPHDVGPGPRRVLAKLVQDGDQRVEVLLGQRAQRGRHRRERSRPWRGVRAQRV